MFNEVLFQSIRFLNFYFTLIKVKLICEIRVIMLGEIQNIINVIYQIQL